MKKSILLLFFFIITFSTFAAPIEAALNKHLGEEVRIYFINYFSEKQGVIKEIKDGLLILEDLCKSEKNYIILI